METKVTVPEEHPTGPEAKEETLELTVPEDHPTDPERPRRDEVTTMTPEDIVPTSPGSEEETQKSIFPNRLLPSIPEGADLPEQHPADPEEQTVEEDGAGHILGGRLRRVADDSKNIFEKQGKKADIIRCNLSPEEKS